MKVIKFLSHRLYKDTIELRIFLLISSVLFLLFLLAYTLDNIALGSLVLVAFYLFLLDTLLWSTLSSSVRKLYQDYRRFYGTSL